MCGFGKTPVSAARPVIAAPDNREATRGADMEARLRRARAGAAASVLTGPSGIPATSSKLGMVQ
jgi:hypothetical protein